MGSDPIAEGSDPWAQSFDAVARMPRKGLTEGGRPLPVHMSSLAKDVSENLSVKSTKIHQSQSRKSISHIDGHAENMLKYTSNP